MGYAGMDRKEEDIDRDLNIHTCQIEEWDNNMLDYHRSEPTPYVALDLFFKHYLPLDNARLVDYGSGLGRINLYFYHLLHMPGIGIEVDSGRVQRAWENLAQYAIGLNIAADKVPIQFLETKAEAFLPPPQTNTFYLFHPFSDWIFRDVLDRITQSIDLADRTVDLILYYPSFGYFQSIQTCGYFEEWLFVDCPWNKDPRDGFWVFRHWAEK